MQFDTHAGHVTCMTNPWYDKYECTSPTLSSVTLPYLDALGANLHQTTPNPQVPMHNLGEIQGLIDRYDRLISIIPMELVTDCLQDKSIDNRCEGGLPGCPTRKSIWLSADLGEGHWSTITVS